DDRTFQMWIDAKYKLIHKVRVYEDTSSQEYSDVGQIYTGGDKVSLFWNYVAGADDWHVKVTVDVDIAKASSNGKVTMKGEEFEGEASITAGRYEGDVVFRKPSDAVPIAELLKQFGFDPTGLSGIYEDTEDSVPNDPSEV